MTFAPFAENTRANKRKEELEKEKKKKKKGGGRRKKEGKQRLLGLGRAVKASSSVSGYSDS